MDETTTTLILASLQRLEAGQERLHVGFQELRAGHDQLRASHDQLRASHDQLRTGYDQLRTTCEDIRAELHAGLLAVRDEIADVERRLRADFLAGLQELRAELLMRLDRVRADIMERIDWLQHSVAQRKDEETVNVGTYARFERMIASAREEARTVGEQYVTLRQMILRLEGMIGELRAERSA